MTQPVMLNECFWCKDKSILIINISEIHDDNWFSFTSEDGESFSQVLRVESHVTGLSYIFSYSSYEDHKDYRITDKGNKYWILRKIDENCPVNMLILSNFNVCDKEIMAKCVELFVEEFSYENDQPVVFPMWRQPVATRI